MRRGFALGAAAVALFLSLWVWLPAPTYPLLALSVGAPELSVWLMAGAALAAWPAWANRRRRLGRVALAMAAAAFALPAFVIARVPGTIAAFERQMQGRLGAGYLDVAPPRVRARLREQPIAVRELFFGQPEPPGRVERGVSYHSLEGVDLTLDVYRPADAGPWPVVVQIYGGAWRDGSPSEDEDSARRLAAAGYVVFAVDYRHAPRWRWPAQRDDVIAGLRWAEAHAAEFDGDPSRLVLLGRSAGAQLAFAAAAQPESPAVDAIVAYYTPVDLTSGYREPPVPDTLDLRRIERDLFGGSPDDFPDLYREASPITLAAQPHPPVLIVGAGRDRIISRRAHEALHAKLAETGVSVYLRIPWADHAFDAVPFGPSAQIAAHYTERFLAWALWRH
jgi:acetyl esterase/lipase